jgi:hypothetical protein
MHLIARTYRASSCCKTLSKKLSSLARNPHFHLIENVITIDEEKALIEYLNPLLKRRRYESDHWDSVITDYKEMELLPITNRGVKMPSNIQDILERMKSLIQSNYTHDINNFFNPHCIDLSEEHGIIDFHIDSIKHSGNVLAGLSLMASRKLILKHDSLCGSNDREGEIPVDDINRRPWGVAEINKLQKLVIENDTKGGNSAVDTTWWTDIAFKLNMDDHNNMPGEKKTLRKWSECRDKYNLLLNNDNDNKNKIDDVVSVKSTRVIDMTEDAASDMEMEMEMEMRIELPQRSLYMLSGPLRYDYAHAIHAGNRRLSIMFRDPPPEGGAHLNIEWKGLRKINNI